MRVRTSRTEALRLAEEEAHGIEIQSHPWWTTPSRQRPNDSEHDLTPLRLVLSREEQERFRAPGADAAALGASQPGVSLGEVLAAIERACGEVGHPDAFHEHHRGGIAGYRPREVFAVPPGEPTCLKQRMAVAWNSTLGGAKVEDTFLLVERELENLTVDPNWPMTSVNGRRRPVLLST